MYKVSAEEAKKKVKVQISLLASEKLFNNDPQKSLVGIYISIHLTERFQIVRLGFWYRA